ncbi:hypothetical protein [Pseudomonas qingdaonensis]|uniref:hypothetical protein n=1 Tax=Pseudomonas qingdaonensis TaxID=2056231 RepID=UPI0028A6A15B|nr:hypothetical protein [Pseudomonas qingdaonensis]
MLLVFCLTLLAGLPARWLFKAAPWPAQDVAGSVWQGQAGRIGDVGPLSWQVRPWAVQVQAGYQGQRWGLVLRGWPWDWQASVMPQGPASRVASAYRLGGEWSGQLALSGRGARCVSGQGALVADQLALVAPWTLALGRGEVRVVCNEGWRLSARLAAAGQHHLALDAGVAGGTLQGQLEQGAALYPVLVGGQWLQAGEHAVRWSFNW